ncbi:MAG: glycosyltransferase family 4 protein [Sedimentisphaerales bacterium]
MRILFISHYFQPEPNFFWGLPFAKELVGRGHNVEILTGFPNYPGGKIYDGYRVRILQRETLEGIPIIRVPVYPSHDISSVKRILCYGSLAISQSLIGPVVIKSADVAYVIQGPATVGLPACIIRLLRRIPFVYDIKDLWPDVLGTSGMFSNRLGLGLVDKWCKFVYKRAGRIVVITPGVKKRLIERGVSEEKIEMIYEWCDDSHICRAEPNEELAKSLGMAGRFNVVFAGNMGKAQSLSAVLDAAKIIGPQYPRIQFVFIGSGVEVATLKEKAAAMCLRNTIFHARRPISEIGAVLRMADVLLVHLKDDPVFHIAIPSKIQAYMVAGRPILIGVKGDAADLVAKAGAGLPCEPENPRSIAETVLKFYTLPRRELDVMGQNGKIFYEQNLSFKIAVPRLEKIFRAVAKK